MAEVQQAELAELVEVIGGALSEFNFYESGGVEQDAKEIAQAIVHAENVFIGASYVKAEAAEGRTVFCILTPAEANALVLFRQTKESGEIYAGTQ